MRQAILDVHNHLRNKLALGMVQRSAHSMDTLPKAADMRAMKYDCTLEKMALDVGVLQDDCKEILPRQKFTDTARNYRYINTTMRFRRPVMSPKEALVKAAHEWWNLHLYYQFEDVTPKDKDFRAIPFFMMAMAATQEVGCAVNFCPSSSRNYYAVYCYYGAPHVKAGKSLYKKGEPCKECPIGYACYGKTKLCRRTTFQLPVN
ncbi:SCP-like protein [Teladorsagia circumcincta]|uniref:SCP-like protein n=1 Tax=Teladorsagia circumcincta TaxID=45464 RepID=A0A2G9U7W8_TELCI|nr:SCP-like protein [Teladorsagia circumcincta]